MLHLYITSLARILCSEQSPNGFAVIMLWNTVWEKTLMLTSQVLFSVVWAQLNSLQYSKKQVRKKNNLAPEQEGILKAEMFLDGPGLSGSSRAYATSSLAQLLWEPRQHWAGFGPDERATGGRGEKQSWTAVPLSKLDTEVTVWRTKQRIDAIDRTKELEETKWALSFQGVWGLGQSHYLVWLLSHSLICWDVIW